MIVAINGATRCATICGCVRDERRELTAGPVPVIWTRRRRRRRRRIYSYSMIL
jgi:hypothetical protein